MTDFGKARVLALKALERRLTHRAFNLGNGFGDSVREVKLGERRPGDSARLISNSDTRRR
jgi:UDP-glucose 4-epimerase